MAQKLSDKTILWRIIKFSWQYKFYFIASLVLALLLAPLGAIRPYLINLGIDQHVMNGDLNGLFWICIIIMSLVLIESVFRYLFSLYTEILGLEITRDIRVNLFQVITTLKMQEFDRTPLGIYITRIVNDIENIKTIYSEGFLTIMADLISIVVIVAAMFATDVNLTFVCLITIPFLMLATYIFNKKVKVSYNMVRNQYAQMNTFLQEHISGMSVVQAFNAQEREKNKFKKINQAYTQANIKSVKYYAIFFPVVDVIAAIAIGLIIWWGAKEVMKVHLNLGVLIAFPMYLTMLFRPIRMLADKFNSIQMGLIAAERVFQLTDNMTLREPDATEVINNFKGLIKFDHVTFSYVDDYPVLKDISFHTIPGKCLAIVGATGSGKSTIVNLIMKFYDYQQGSITIDGYEVKKLNKAALRSHFSLVLQDVFLFTGSIQENISLRRHDISLDQIEQAAKKLELHDFILSLPDGYQFKLAERGSNLSAGQRQLISLVRAMLFAPDVLIMDEATSNIDIETEALIQKALEHLLKGRTSIIVAHRLSTISHADHILVLEHGQLIEQGKPSELLSNEQSAFSVLYGNQFNLGQPNEIK